MLSFYSQRGGWTSIGRLGRRPRLPTPRPVVHAMVPSGRIHTPSVNDKSKHAVFFSTRASERHRVPSSYRDPDQNSITSIRLEVHHNASSGIGLLQSVLQHFVAHGVNLRRIESRPLSPEHYQFDMTVDGAYPHDPQISQLLQSLHDAGHVVRVVEDATAAIWFPQHRAELDQIIHRTIQASADDNTAADANALSADHPGFRDPVYRQRRAELAAYAHQYRWQDDHAGIPIIDYTEAETGVWQKVWDQMQPLLQKYACREYLQALEQMQLNCQYSRDHIPQQAEISQYLQQVTQFRLRPVAGLLSSRDFLNALALRVFCSTQYIRHASQPYYTPEPDICHELLGHVPMLTNPTFANFSQQIGLASLGASDADIDKLAKCYWHSVEFGLCSEDGQPKAYGAGLLSSFGELEYACGPSKEGEGPEYMAWDPEVAAFQEFPITTYQPVYFVTPSIETALEQMQAFGNRSIHRPFHATYDPETERILVDRPIARTPVE